MNADSRRRATAPGGALDRIAAPAAWRLVAPDPAVRVAVVDDGVDAGHEALAGAVAGGYDVFSGEERQAPAPWDGHGTACAGAIAAAPRPERGVRGVASGASLLAVRAFRSPAPGAPWDPTPGDLLAAGITWAWRSGAAVVCAAWGGVFPSPAVARAIAGARERGRGGRGTVVVCAAGNDGRGVSFPATLPGVLVVAACDEEDRPIQPAGSPLIALAAPGVRVATTDIRGAAGFHPDPGEDGHYTTMFGGTSAACALVAGACALVLAADPTLRESEVRALVTAAAAPVAGGPDDRRGRGRLDVHRAVAAAIAGRDRSVGASARPALSLNAADNARSTA